jgi:hypothetical protein
MGYLGYGGGYGGGFGGYGGGYGMYPSSVLGSGYFGSYIYNNAGGYSSGVPTNPAFKAPELTEAQAMPLIEWPLYHGPNQDINDPAHRPVLFSDKWINQSSTKEKTFDLLMTGTALLAVGLITTFAFRGLLAAPGNIVKDATRHW